MAKKSSGLKRNPISKKPGESKTARDRDLEAFVGQAKGDSDGLEEVIASLSPEEHEPVQERIKIFNLRMPESLHSKLGDIADATGKSMHEVVMTLLVPALEKAHDRYAE